MQRTHYGENVTVSKGHATEVYGLYASTAYSSQTSAFDRGEWPASGCST